MKLIFKIIPWVLLTLLAVYFYLGKKEIEEETVFNSEIVLQEVVGLGKMELAKFHIQDIVELKDKQKIATIFVSHSKAVLIAAGEAVGCIDLSKITKDDILKEDSTLFITIPQPEICYAKLDLKKSRLYDLEVGFLGNSSDLVQKIYKQAEHTIEESAQSMGIIEETKKNANIYLKNFLQATTGMQVEIEFEEAIKLKQKD